MMAAPAGNRQGGAYQLVEVTHKTAASVLSQPTSPNIPLLSSPATQPMKSPKPSQANDGEGQGDEEELPPWLPEAADWEAAEAEDTRVGEQQTRWHEQGEEGPGNMGLPEIELAEGEFDPRNFIGDWTDNLGHRITVTPAEQRGGGRRRGKGRNAERPRLAFLAVMYKVGVPEKRFTINKDRWGENWTCGNGCLSHEDSHSEVVTWETENSRKSIWQRIPPEGAVFFDPPPESNWEEFAHEVGWGEQQQGYYMVPPQGEGGENAEIAEAWQGWEGGQGQQWMQENETEGGNGQIKDGSFNPNAKEFVPMWGIPAEGLAEAAGAAIRAPAAQPQGTPKLVPLGTPSQIRRGRTPSASPMLKALPSPALGPRPSPGMRSPAQGPLPSPAIPPAQAITILLGEEESPDVKVEGAWLEWSLPDPWSKLSKFPKDFCITSPMFGVRSAANMQLAFYPNGSRTAEAGLCTLSLTRGPDSAGLKFEFLVNGRGIGPKVCLGRRYLGDYPKPFGDSKESNDQKVVVRMQVLKVL